MTGEHAEDPIGPKYRLRVVGWTDEALLSSQMQTGWKLRCLRSPFLEWTCLLSLSFQPRRRKMTSLWTPKLQQEFHEAIERLCGVTTSPSAEASYPEPPAETEPGTYTLRLRDELQLANHVAFLAHAQEGVQAISGVYVEEAEEGLVIRLASNHTPSQSVVLGLQKILDSMARGAAMGE